METEATPKPLIGLCSRANEEDNSFSLPADYSRAVVAAGGLPLQIPLIPSAAKEIASAVHAIVLCGSASDVDPVRYGQGRHPQVKSIHSNLDETGYELLEHAFQAKKPVLGICFGMQLLNVFLEGTLIQHIPEAVPGALPHKDRRTRHALVLEDGSHLAEWANGGSDVVVNSTHHQSIQTLGLGLRVSARTSDGIIEAVEGVFPGHFVIGVQWHPERIWKEEKLSRRIFCELVRAAERRLACASGSVGTSSYVKPA